MEPRRFVEFVTSARPHPLKNWARFGQTEAGFLSSVRFERLPNIRFGNRGGRQARLLMNYLVSLRVCHGSWTFGEGGGEELRHQSRQSQELSPDATGHQLIFKMGSEHQTVDFAHMKHTTINRENRFVGLLHVSLQLHFHKNSVTMVVRRTQKIVGRGSHRLSCVFARKYAHM